MKNVSIVWFPVINNISNKSFLSKRPPYHRCISYPTSPNISELSPWNTWNIWTITQGTYFQPLARTRKSVETTGESVSILISYLPPFYAINGSPTSYMRDLDIEVPLSHLKIQSHLAWELAFNNNNALPRKYPLPPTQWPNKYLYLKTCTILCLVPYLYLKTPPPDIKSLWEISA